MSLAGRPAGGLYVAAWALGGFGVAALVVGFATDPPLAGVLVMAGITALIAGLALAAGHQLIARHARPAERFRGPAPLILFALQVALVNAFSLILFAIGRPLETDPAGFFAATVVLLMGYLVVVWLFVVRAGALSWRDIVRAWPLDAGRVAFDIALGAATMLGVALVASILGGLLAQLLGTQAPDVVPPPKTAVDILLIAAAAGVLVPIGEELFFRGYALTAWLRDVGARSALIRTTVFFALVHLINITVEPGAAADGAKQAVLELAVIAPVGFALGWLYLRRGLIAAIAGHAALNLFAVLILVLSQYLPAPLTGS